MHIDVTKSEFETIINALKGVMLRCDSKLREQLARRLNWQLLRRSLEIGVFCRSDVHLNSIAAAQETRTRSTLGVSVIRVAALFALCLARIRSRFVNLRRE